MYRNLNKANKLYVISHTYRKRPCHCRNYEHGVTYKNSTASNVHILLHYRNYQKLTTILISFAFNHSNLVTPKEFEQILTRTGASKKADIDASDFVKIVGKLEELLNKRTSNDDDDDDESNHNMQNNNNNNNKNINNKINDEASLKKNPVVVKEKGLKVSAKNAQLAEKLGDRNDAEREDFSRVYQGDEEYKQMLKKLNKNNQNDDDDDVDDDDDSEIIDTNDEEELLRETFRTLAKSRERISLTDFLQWSELQELLQLQAISREDLNRAITSVGINLTRPEKATIDFEKVNLSISKLVIC